MKKTKFFKKLIISVLALSMVLGNFCMAFAEEQSNKPADEQKAELVVSTMGYDSIGGMYGDTIVAKKDDKWGMAKFDGTVVVPFEYDDCYFFDKKSGVCVFRNNPDMNLNYSTFIYNNVGNLIYECKTGASMEITVTDSGVIFMDYQVSVMDVHNYILIDSSTGKIIDKKESLYTAFSHASNGWYVIYGDACLLCNGDREIEIKLGDYGRPFYINGDYVLFSKNTEYENKVENNALYSDIETYCYQISTGKYHKIDSYTTPLYENTKFFGVAGNKIMISNVVSRIDQSEEVYALYDIDRNAITEEKYTSIEGTGIVKKYYLVSENDKWFYIDLEGKEYGTDLKDAGAFYDGQAIVLNADGQAYIIDESFKQLSEVVSAEAVTSYNKNAYAITVNGKIYPAYMKTPTYTKELAKGAEVISTSDFASILTENATKDVVIKNADGVTFTFAKGTMKAVDGKTEYDFGTNIITDYSKATELSTEVTKDNFVLQIDYNYSGQLPAKASIIFNVGSELAGKTLYYYLYNTDKTYKIVQSVVVADDGSVTVKQDHCSTYVLTSAELNVNKAPAAGDSTNYGMFIILAVISLGTVVLVSRKRMSERAWL